MFILSIGRSYSDDQFIFPKEKPSIFKKVDKKEPELESFEDLKEKKDVVKSFKVDKKDIISDDDLSDEDISDYEDEDKDTDIKDETEPNIKEDPTLF